MSILSKGDLVDVVAPSYGDFDVSEEQIKQVLEYLGLKARIPKNLQKKNADFFSAHNLEMRSKHFINAITAKDSKAIWCLRGGYGAAKIVPELEKINLSKHNKPIIGYSDITALHLYLSSKYDFRTVHGRNLSEFFTKKISSIEKENITSLLFENGFDLKMMPLNTYAKKESLNIEAAIIGGNLTLVTNSLATDWQISTKDKILLLEDAFEEKYRIDRSLNHLYQAGVFDKVKAVIFGDIELKEEKSQNTRGLDVEEFIMDFIKKLNVPVYHTPQIGHGKINNPVVFGNTYAIQNSILRFQV
ncbi:MAG: LD-carboxypeptidase [Rickettsiales bacterium]